MIWCGMFNVVETEEYIKWKEGLNIKEQAQVDARISKIKLNGHFGNAKKLDASLAELKWKNGRRVYFATTVDENGNVIILLLGGNKNSQSKDITQARKIIRQLANKG